MQTGDIPAMWLRDSSAQTIPYIRYQAAYPVLRARFAGVIERNARNVLTDPYANALDADYHVWERKWEVDSLAWPVILAWIYWHVDRGSDRFYARLAPRAANHRRHLPLRRTAPNLQPVSLSLSRLYQ